MADVTNAVLTELCSELHFKLPHDYQLKDGLEAKSFKADQVT